jgi:DNA-binding SARP family transcriptional activator
VVTASRALIVDDRTQSGPLVASPLDVRVLGTLSVRRDDGELPLGGRKQRLVLACLLAHPGSTVSARGIVDAVWGDDATPGVSISLRAYVSNLRKILGPRRIVTHGIGYRGGFADDALDTALFEQLVHRAIVSDDAPTAHSMLESALSLWHGAPFEDLGPCRALDGMRARLTELHGFAREAYFRHSISLGMLGETVAGLEQAVVEQPERETTWGLLALSLYRDGRRVEALRCFQRVRHALREFGLEPGPALRRLEAEIAADDPLAGRGFAPLAGDGSGATG